MRLPHLFVLSFAAISPLFAQSQEQVQEYQQKEQFQTNPYYNLGNACLGWDVEVDKDYPYVIFTHYNAQIAKYDIRYLCGLDKNKQQTCLQGDPESREFNKGPVACEESCPPPIWNSGTCMPITDKMKAMMYPPENLDQNGQQQW